MAGADIFNGVVLSLFGVFGYFFGRATDWKVCSESVLTPTCIVAWDVFCIFAFIIITWVLTKGRDRVN